MPPTDHPSIGSEPDFSCPPGVNPDLHRMFARMTSAEVDLAIRKLDLLLEAAQRLRRARCAHRRNS